MSQELKFEEALAKLEAIVEKLEVGDIPLEEALEAFEEGVKLSRICLKMLDEAEKRIEILVKGEGGDIQLQPFKVESTNENGA